ncbi:MULTISPECIES: DUF3179 domain-containing (seleno)protein [unclassified Iodidimonas]|uniref:DUF3179 domain-containing (seleno)protein n=1 Tax=unclassified Iodidimonas TaxID=2626145 RepID=UPI002482A3D0|nr:MULTISPECIES: DUF3179 domain-containing (seleno)protein [unclassified Iodidimonas]
MIKAMTGSMITPRQVRLLFASALLVGLAVVLAPVPGFSQNLVSQSFQASWPDIDLAKEGIDGTALRVLSDDETPLAYDDPALIPVAIDGITGNLEPVIAVEINGQLRAYPMRIVAAHRIVNDTLGGVPIAVTYCRVCSSAMVFRRVVDEQSTHLRLTGASYDQNIILYDEASRTWWQQINGLGLAGPHADGALDVVPSHLISFASFLKQAAKQPGTLILADSDYSRQPLSLKQTVDLPPLPGMAAGLNSTDRVVIVGKEAWPLELLRKSGRIEQDDLLIIWEPGRMATPDYYGADQGQDVGNITAYSRRGDDLLERETRIQLLHAFFQFSDGEKLHLKRGQEQNEVID